ncbi:MAG: hypothetical protein NUV50_00040 [Rhodospirillales bacterium]|nr:hypothetical protein [Rhodospirillales bacterium]
MPDRYQAVLTATYASFLDSSVLYPATGKDAKPVLQDAQKQKIATLVNTGPSSLNTTLAACGQVLSNAQNGQYSSKAALESDVSRNTPLLSAQVSALGSLFEGFKREEDAWVKQGATLSWDARTSAVTAQRAVAAQFVAAVQGIQNSVAADFQAAIKAYGPTPTPKPKPAIDWEGQREALLDAALDGALFVAIDTALLAA